MRNERLLTATLSAGHRSCWPLAQVDEAKLDRDARQEAYVEESAARMAPLIRRQLGLKDPNAQAPQVQAEAADDDVM